MRYQIERQNSKGWRGILVGLGLLWLGSAIGIGSIAVAFVDHRVPPWIHWAVVEFSGTQESVPLAYAWSLRAGIFFAMLGFSATVIGLRLYKKLRTPSNAPPRGRD